jgi:hypothetical protein
LKPNAKLKRRVPSAVKKRSAVATALLHSAALTSKAD